MERLSIFLMGQHKIKQYSREEYLKHNPFCCYCGAPATTTDHIPSRHYFLRRDWPEGFEFPACKACNEETRNDEQVVAFLFNLRLIDSSPTVEELAKKLAKAIANNAPDILQEWREKVPTSHRARRTAFRDAFGPLGDELRKQSVGLIDAGPLTGQAVDRFIAKLAKVLFYKHVGRILDGYVFVDWHSIYIGSAEFPHERINNILRVAPIPVLPGRSGRSMIDQFFYRYGCDAERGLLFVSVMFSEQMMFDVIAITDSYLENALDIAGRSEARNEYEIWRHKLKFRNAATEALFPHTNFPRTVRHVNERTFCP